MAEPLILKNYQGPITVVTGPPLAPSAPMESWQPCAECRAMVRQGDMYHHDQWHETLNTVLELLTERSGGQMRMWPEEVPSLA